VALIRATGNAELAKWAEHHAEIIHRFGRFPHRNAALGRATTPEEQEFLDRGGFKGLGCNRDRTSQVALHLPVLGHCPASAFSAGSNLILGRCLTAFAERNTPASGLQ
jgi:Bacterial protein of unknown function (DUF924)